MAARRRRSPALDDALVASLSTGASYAEAGQIVGGLSERTVRRRMADGEFRARVQAASDDAMSRASAVLSGAARNAALKLTRLAQDADSQQVQLAAAKAVLAAAIPVAEHVEIEARVAALEDRVRARLTAVPS